jgi:hypothetical protein
MAQRLGLYMSTETLGGPDPWEHYNNDFGGVWRMFWVINIAINR